MIMKLITLMAWLAIPCQLMAQPRNLWVRRYTEVPVGRGGIEFNDIYQLNNNNYALCGSMNFGQNSRGLWLLTTAENGNIDLNRCYLNGQQGGSISGYSIIESNQGGFVVGGTGDINGATQFLLTRISDEGDVIWWNHYGARSGECKAVIELKDGDYIACGWDREFNAALMGFIIRVDRDGELVWERRFDEIITFYALKETDGGIVLTGYDSFVVKLNFDGENVWSHRLGGSSAFKDLTSCPGGFAMCGSINVPRDDGSININHRLVHINAEGEVNWDQNYDLGEMETSSDITRTEENGFLISGYRVGERGTMLGASLMRTDQEGNLVWSRIDTLIGNVRPEIYYSSIRDRQGALVVAGNCRPAQGGSMGGLITKIVPERSAPTIINWSPDSLRLDVLEGDSVEFWVRAVDIQGDALRYFWMLDDEEIAVDSLIIIDFPDIGEHLVRCVVSDGELANSIRWHVTVTDLYIQSFTPDTLNLTIRRGVAVDFTIDSVATIGGNEDVQYLWTKTNLDNQGEPERSGEDAQATIPFLQSGNYAVEGFAYRGESHDAVVWNVAVRGAIWSFAPEDITLEVLPDSLVRFEVVPSEPENDSLSILWLVDGEVARFDETTLDWRFSSRVDNLTPYQVTVIVMDSEEIDTVTWAVKVWEPDFIGDESPADLPRSAALLSVSPNPFNSTLTIRFTTGSAAIPTRLTIYDLSGREVARLVESGSSVNPPWLTGRNSADHRGSAEETSSATWDASAVPAGVYLVRLQTGQDISTRKVVLIR